MTVPQTRMQEMEEDVRDMLEEIKWVPDFAIDICVGVSPRDKKRWKEAKESQAKHPEAAKKELRFCFRCMKQTICVWVRFAAGLGTIPVADGCMCFECGHSSEDWQVKMTLDEFEKMYKENPDFITLPCLYFGKQHSIIRVRPSQIRYYYEEL